MPPLADAPARLKRPQKRSSIPHSITFMLLMRSRLACATGPLQSPQLEPRSPEEIAAAPFPGCRYRRRSRPPKGCWPAYRPREVLRVRRRCRLERTFSFRNLQGLWACTNPRVVRLRRAPACLRGRFALRADAHLRLRLARARAAVLRGLRRHSLRRLPARHGAQPQ